MPQIMAKLLISIDDAGRVAVEGCINNKLLSYGLLDIARDVVKETCDAAEKRIKEPTAEERAALLASGVK